MRLSPSLPQPATLAHLEFWDEFRLPRLLASFAAGLLTGTIGAIRGISYAALIFSGSLAPYLNIGVGAAIYSTAAISVVVALLSSLPGAIATPLAAPTAVLAVLAAAIAHRLGSSDPEVLVATVLAAIALGSLLTGFLLWLLGALKLGKLISIVPYPVVGGFMAGTGWLLVGGAVQVTTDRPLTWGELANLVQPAIASHWLAALGLALLLSFFTKQFTQFWVLPAVLLAALASFYIILWLVGMPLAEARAAGWLLGPFPPGDLWQPLTWGDLPRVQWAAIAPEAGTLATLALTSLLSLVMTNSGIELALGRDLDLDTELQAVGLANLAAGAGSGMAGNQALPSTLLVHKMGAANRLSGVFKTVPCAAVLILGSHLLAAMPKPILGSLLLFLGFDLLVQWLYKAACKLSLPDYATIWLTMVAIVTAGFLAGILVGLAAAVLLFVWNCAQQDIASAEFNAATVTGGRARSPEQHQWFEQHADDLWVLQLQGFLFFGTAHRLLARVRQRLAERPPRCLLLDCRYLTGCDASAALSFAKLAKLVEQHHLQLVFAGLKEPQLALLRQEGLFLEPTAGAQQFANWQEALAYCEAVLRPAELGGDSGSRLPPSLLAAPAGAD